MPIREEWLVEDLIHEISYPVFILRQFFEGSVGATLATFRPQNYTIKNWGFTKEKISHDTAAGKTFQALFGYRLYAEFEYLKCPLSDYQEFMKIWKDEHRVNNDRLLYLYLHGGHETPDGVVFPADTIWFNIYIDSVTMPSEYFGNIIKSHNLSFTIRGAELLDEDPRFGLMRSRLSSETAESVVSPIISD